MRRFGRRVGHLTISFPIPKAFRVLTQVAMATTTAIGTEVSISQSSAM